MALAATTGGFRFGDVVPKESVFHIYQADRIALWGDSLGDTNWLYHSFFQAAVDAWFTTRGLTPPTWINRHAGGATTAYIEHADQRATAIADNPNGIILLIGINDVPAIARATSVSNINTFWDGVSGTLTRLRRFQLSPWEKGGSEADIRLYRTDYANAARTRNIPFVDLRAAQDIDNVPRTADGVHPSNPLGRSWISSRALFQTELHAERWT
jgi:lysophospholipase L1-like esterase